MTCDEARELIGPYRDGELDLGRSVELEQHLGGCPACATRVEGLRRLSDSLTSPGLYHPAPDSLRRRLIDAVVPSSPPRRRPSSRFVGLVGGVGMALGVGAVLLLMPWMRSDDEAMVERVLVGHVRSLQAEHATDVASSDRHTVKPWFRGRLEFSPPVPDLVDEGYPLTGGRLDYLFDRPVAALLYHRRLHPINVFVWPSDGEDETAPGSWSRRGYHLRQWRGGGMVYWAASDLGDAELDEFVRQFRGRVGP